jgi:Acetyltransferase (GNAT) domain
VSSDELVAFRRWGLRIGEAYFDAAAADAPNGDRVDLVRILSAFSPPSHRGSRQRHTLVIGLADDEDQLLAQVSKETRSKIRRAADRDPVEVAGDANPSPAEVSAFADFYDRFAADASVAPVFRPRLHALAERGKLVLTKAFDGSGEVLVRHAYVAVGGRGYMLYSGSVLADSGDSGARNLIGRANRYLHWEDIRLFKSRGFELYDFGGLDVEERTPKTAGIARFKRGFGGEVRPVYSLTRPVSLRGAAAHRILSLRGVDF